MTDSLEAQLAEYQKEYINNCNEIERLSLEYQNLNILFNSSDYRNIREIINICNLNRDFIRRRCVINKNLKIFNKNKQLEIDYANIVILCNKIAHIKKSISEISRDYNNASMQIKRRLDLDNDFSHILLSYNHVKDLKNTLNKLTQELLSAHNKYIADSTPKTNCEDPNQEVDKIIEFASLFKNTLKTLDNLKNTNKHLKNTIEELSNKISAEKEKTYHEQREAEETLNKIKLMEEEKEKELSNYLMEKENRRKIKMSKITTNKRRI